MVIARHAEDISWSDPFAGARTDHALPPWRAVLARERELIDGVAAFLVERGGLGEYAQLIREHYGSLEAYLDRHQIDILCLQEVKVTHTTELQKLSRNKSG